MAITAEQKARILENFRTGKAKSAAELGKQIGVSRSAVYRVLSSARKVETTTVEVPTKKLIKPMKPTLEIKEATEKINKPRSASIDSRESDAESQVSYSFFQRSEKFADTLGLPEPSGFSHHMDDKKGISDEEREENVEAAMGMVLGSTAPKSRLLEELELDGPLAFKSPPKVNRSKQVPVKMENYFEEPTPQAIFVDRGDLTQRILFNVEHFGPLLKGIVGPNPQEFIQGLEKRGDFELKALLNTLERTRSVGNIASGFKQTFYVVGQATEVVTKLAGMKTDGFVEQLRQQDTEVSMIMKELAIDQWETLKGMNSPEMRLGALFCLTLIQTDAGNRMKSHFHVNDTVDNSTVSQHSDL